MTRKNEHSDPFEEWIKQNKTTMEEQSLNTDALWQKIEKDLDADTKVRRLPIRRWVSIAASVVLVVSVFFLGRQYQSGVEQSKFEIELAQIKQAFQDQRVAMEASFANEEVPAAVLENLQSLQTERKEIEGLLLSQPAAAKDKLWIALIDNYNNELRALKKWHKKHARLITRKKKNYDL